MIIKTNMENRKALVKAISEFIGQEQKYLGPPSFAFTVGCFTVDRDGTVTCESDDESKKLKAHLIQLGCIKPEIQDLEISVPIEGMNSAALRNLVYMLYSKQYLLNKVVGSINFSVSEDLIKSLEKNPPETKEGFITVCREQVDALKGIAFDEERITFTFAISDNAKKNKAYTEVAALMVAQAKEAKHISALEQKPENEKYYLRIWLLRLGLDGEGAKAARKALLNGLKGHTAFRTPEDEEKHKNRLLAKKTGSTGNNLPGENASNVEKSEGCNVC